MLVKLDDPLLPKNAAAQAANLALSALKAHVVGGASEESNPVWGDEMNEMHLAITISMFTREWNWNGNDE